MDGEVTVLVTGAGGPASTSFIRSLRDSSNPYRILGVEADRFAIYRSEADETYPCFKATERGYLHRLNEIIFTKKVDFLHVQPDPEIEVVSKNRKQILCKTFLPRTFTVEDCLDKFASYKFWEAKGLVVPKTILLNDRKDVTTAYNIFGKDLWIRATTGAAGRGSLSRPSREMAIAHLDSNELWGKATAAKHLTADTVTWQSIWEHGFLVVGQGRKRKNWVFGNRTQSGVTGLTGVGVTVSDPIVDRLAIKAITAIDPCPNGIFSVDFTYDENGVPNPTEINIGRFFTTHHFLTRAGCNMPDIFVQLGMGRYKGRYKQFNPCRSDMYWIRGIDTQPVLLHKSELIHD